MNKFQIGDIVKCIEHDNMCLTVNGLYEVLDIDGSQIRVQDNEGDEYFYDKDEATFEIYKPVIDLSKTDNEIDTKQNSVDDAQDSLGNNANTYVKPKFKVGDKVYFGTEPDIKTISEVGNDNGVQFVGELGWASGYSCCHATQENYERLQATFPDINFEAPPKELTGSDLCRAMLDKGWKYVPCYVSNYGESEAQKPCIVRKFSSNGQFVSEFEFYNHAIPFDPKTGDPLTQAVLDE